MDMTKDMLEQILTDKANALLGKQEIEITKQMTAQTEQIVNLRNDMEKEIATVKDKFGPMADIEKHTRRLAEDQARSKISKLTPEQSEVFMAITPFCGFNVAMPRPRTIVFGRSTTIGASTL